jgi:hypothetical protein
MEREFGMPVGLSWVLLATTPTYKNLPTTHYHRTLQVATQINSHSLRNISSPHYVFAPSKLNEEEHQKKISRLPVSRGCSLVGVGSSKSTTPRSRVVTAIFDAE